MARAILLACVIPTCVGVLCAGASAQDVAVLMPPELPPIVPEEERPRGADQLRFGIQLDVEKEIALLPLNFGGVVVYRPAPATLEGDRWLLRPLASFRLRSPGKGTEAQVASRTLVSGAELELGAGVEAVFGIAGILSAYARWDGALALHQASVERTMPTGDEQDRLLTVGLARTGPGAGLIVGPVLVGVDLHWHWVLLGAETFTTYEEIVRDGPRLGVSLAVRLSSHLSAHFRMLPSSEQVLPPERWTVGMAASFDPLTE